MSQGGILGLLCRDIGLCAGGARLGDGLGGQMPGLGDQGDLIHRQGCQGRKGQRAVLSDHLLDQGCLAYGDAVLLGQSIQIRALRHCLAEDSPLQGTALEDAVDGIRQVLLELGGFCGVLVLHGHQDGVLDIAEITVLEHGADEGVHCHVQVRAGQIHVAQDNLCVLVEGGDGEHPLLGADGHGEAGVHIQHHHGVHGVGSPPAADAESTTAHDHQGGSHCQGRPAALLFRSLKREDSSRLRAAGGQDAVQRIRSGVLHGGPQALFQFTFVQVSLPPSMRVGAFSKPGCIWREPWGAAGPAERRSPGAAGPSARGG